MIFVKRKAGFFPTLRPFPITFHYQYKLAFMQLCFYFCFYSTYYKILLQTLNLLQGKTRTLETCFTRTCCLSLQI